MTADETIVKGIKLVESGNLDSGLELINESISLDPTDPEKIHVRAQVNAAVGKYKEAISDYKKCIFLKDDMYQYYYNLARVYFKIKQFELAVDFYTSAIKINPSDPDIYSNRGICYIQIFQHKLAFADLQKALSMNPNDRVAHNGLSILMTVDPNIGE